MENQTPSIQEQIEALRDEHTEQFNIAINAAFQRGFGRWFDDTWTSARAAGAKPNAFISAMFVFLTTMLTKKFVAGFHPDMPMEDREQAIMGATRLLKTYLDQIEASAIKELYMPKPESTPEPVTPKGKQTIILPKKGVRH